MGTRRRQDQRCRIPFARPPALRLQRLHDWFRLPPAVARVAALERQRLAHPQPSIRLASASPAPDCRTRRSPPAPRSPCRPAPAPGRTRPRRRTATEPSCAALPLPAWVVDALVAARAQLACVGVVRRRLAVYLPLPTLGE